MSATIEDVARIALALPEAHERPAWGKRAWRIKDRMFVWERPLNPSDVKALEQLGKEIPEGLLLGVRTDGMDAKEAILIEDSELFLTIPHFVNYPAVLLRLDQVELDELQEIIVEAWLARAPKTLAEEYRAEHPPDASGSDGDRPELPGT
jgi:hypothetical protein